MKRVLPIVDLSGARGCRYASYRMYAVDIRTNHLCRYSRRRYSHKSVGVSLLLRGNRLGRLFNSILG